MFNVMDFKNYKMEIIAVSSTLIFNVTLNLIVGFIEADAMILTGLAISPVIGGVVRGILVPMKNQGKICLSMIALNTFVLVPALMVITSSWDGSYTFGMAMGFASSVIALFALGITLVGRIILQTVNEKKDQQPSRIQNIAEYKLNENISSDRILHCPNCNNVLTEKTKFCGYCGSELEI